MLSLWIPVVCYLIARSYYQKTRPWMAAAVAQGVAFLVFLGFGFWLASPRTLGGLIRFWTAPGDGILVLLPLLAGSLVVLVWYLVDLVRFVLGYRGDRAEIKGRTLLSMAQAAVCPALMLVWCTWILM